MRLQPSAPLQTGQIGTMHCCQVYTSVGIYTFSIQVLEPAFRAPYMNVNRWFLTCINQPQFKAVLGEVEICTKMATFDGEGKTRLLLQSCQLFKITHPFFQLRNTTSCSPQRRRRHQRRKRTSQQQRRKSPSQRPNQKMRNQRRTMNQPPSNQSLKILMSASPKGEQQQAVFNTQCYCPPLPLSVVVALLIWMPLSARTRMKTLPRRLFLSFGRTLTKKDGVFGRPRTTTPRT